MKSLAAILFLFCVPLAYAATPTFQSFDTNAFIPNPGANTIQANTSSSNPNSLVKQSQITAGGISLAQATNVINGSSGVIGTNGTDTTFKFSSTGTNQIQGLAQTIANTTSNSLNTSINTASNSINTTINSSSNNIVVALPPRTNYVAITNSPGTAGKALVIVGKDANGSVLTTETNWPSGGSVPNGLVTNNADADILVTHLGNSTTIHASTPPSIETSVGTFNQYVVVTNTGVAIKMTASSAPDGGAALVFSGTTNLANANSTLISTSMISGTLTANGGNSNWLNGFTRLEMGPWLQLTNAGPANGTVVRSWFPVTNNGTVFYLPGYQ